jgi:hypothetical protein
MTAPLPPPKGPWYCPRCGAEVRIVIASIDPRYPLGRCPTNGKVALTASSVEASRLAELYRKQ